MSALAILQRIRMKGRVKSAELAAAVGVTAATAESTIGGLIDAGLVLGPESLRLSPSGRERLEELLREERRAVDSDRLLALYESFREVNADLKALLGDWQLKDGVANQHDDADYDAAVLVRLKPIHERVVPLITDEPGRWWNPPPPPSR